ncbi:hypothetical protein L207DRAFT_626994 [Hyaloscypha variabilis F]|uniref:Uncharacterized protein n=1 Tax=Hyaloscypha variabilis (strain UAMH 11265 / GT02V1 / F) TaxID=1149755 RepID=A0A2J6SBV3_HYAVF|nr:hypothetical protein L207DRAFT_626994 [Hyaloscypha variabilis F]
MEKVGQVRIFEKSLRPQHSYTSRLSLRRNKSGSGSLASESPQAVDPSILTILQPQIDERGNPYAPTSPPSDFHWYLKWLCVQISILPEAEASLLADDPDSNTIRLRENSRFHRTFLAINQIIRSEDNLSIDEILEKLMEKNPLAPYSGTQDVLVVQRRLVFAMLGWQSMLFLPAPNTRRSSNLNIYRAPGEPNSGLIFDDWSVSTDLADRPLAILLKAFGNLLPARSRSSENIASELTKQAFSWKALSSSDINGYLLHTLLRVHIRWVDTLSLHLDYDKSTRSLSLFRHPSFCVAMLQSRGAIYSFASTELYPIDPRATSDEITHFLKETLLSYRLFFGQAKASRRFFRNMLKSETVLRCNPDPLLRMLCLDEYFAHPLVPPDRTVYVTARDFLVLGSRVERLANELDVAKPKSLIDLLHDRRDTLQYWTFWFVAFFGGIGIFLNMVQVVLASIQVLQASGKIA